MTIAVVEIQALLQVVLAALIAGVGITVLFSMVIYCTTRADELRKAHSPVLATILGGLALAGLLACLGSVAFGIHVMTLK
ncbi:MAG: hypothetical protein QOG62_2540 [Thermoleophilaceae bacterium]|jgi:hypothetical protein|nr:hypothetical protein [Thermoleophilaceae bacterium]